MAETGAIKSYTDGSFGGRTARLSEPYADAPGETGQWVVDPDELADGRGRDRAGYQFTAHAIGDEAIDAVLDAYEEESHTDPARRVTGSNTSNSQTTTRRSSGSRRRAWSPASSRTSSRGGRRRALRGARLGAERTAETNCATATCSTREFTAFGSDGMPMDPLLASTTPSTRGPPAQRLTVTEALRAYTGARRTRASTRTGSARSSPASAPISPSSTRRREESDAIRGSTWR